MPTAVAPFALSTISHPLRLCWALESTSIATPTGLFHPDVYLWVIDRAEARASTVMTGHTRTQVSRDFGHRVWFYTEAECKRDGRARILVTPIGEHSMVTGTEKGKLRKPGRLTSAGRGSLGAYAVPNADQTVRWAGVDVAPIAADAHWTGSSGGGVAMVPQVDGLPCVLPGPSTRRRAGREGVRPPCDLCGKDRRVAELLCGPCLEMLQRVALAQSRMVGELRREWESARKTSDVKRMNYIVDKLQAFGVAL